MKIVKKLTNLTTLVLVFLATTQPYAYNVASGDNNMSEAGMLFVNQNLTNDYLNLYREHSKKNDQTNSTTAKLRRKIGLMTADQNNAPTLYAMVEKYATKLGIEVPKILITTHESLVQKWVICSPAATWSLTQSKAVIIVSNELLQYSNTNEVEAVIAHELAHIKHNHVPKKMALHCALFCFFSYVVPLYVPGTIFSYVCLDISWLPEILQPCLLNIKPLLLATFPLTSGYSRATEKEADTTAMSILEKPEGLVTFFEKIAPYCPHYETTWEKITYYFSTHPENRERIKYCTQAAQAPSRRSSSSSGWSGAEAAAAA
ncbi:M48 family metalloprotease [Candidatus Babeliales bacterium]|nr:M48 family metalloprotease [Candidatus Babeliales bacterium]